MSNLKIVVKSEETKLWFTADSHYHHKNICSATSGWVNPPTLRHFDSLSHMNDSIVGNINSVVLEDDTLIHLGDWSFGGFDMIREFRERLVCKNIYLVLGNHDHHIKKNRENIRELFVDVFDYLCLDVRVQEKEFTNKYRIICFHHPIASWDGMGDGTFHLYGHLHSRYQNRINDGRCMDVGMDSNNLFPVSIQEVIRDLRDRPKIGFRLKNDHHEKR